MVKLISWNVNGLRANLKKGFMDYFNAIDADMFCMQETKMEQGQAEIDIPAYKEYWNSAQKKRLLWHGDFYQTRTAVGELWARHRGA